MGMDVHRLFQTDNGTKKSSVVLSSSPIYVVDMLVKISGPAQRLVSIESLGGGIRNEDALGGVSGLALLAGLSSPLLRVGMCGGGIDSDNAGLGRYKVKGRRRLPRSYSAEE